MRQAANPSPARTGGEVLAAADTAATAAAREAESGAWLAELEADALPRISAPGLPCGLFGSWAEPDLPDGASGQSTKFRPSHHKIGVLPGVIAPCQQLSDAPAEPSCRVSLKHVLSAHESFKGVGILVVHSSRSARV